MTFALKLIGIAEILNISKEVVNISFINIWVGVSSAPSEYHIS